MTAIHESIFAFKVAFAACELAIALLLLAELRRLGHAEHWVLVYAWNPLLVTCVAHSGHIDILGVLLLMLSAAALQRRWRTVAAVTFGLAIAVKFLPIVLTPLYWRRVRVRDAFVAILIVGLLYVPFLHRGWLRWDRSGCSCNGFASMIQSSRRSRESPVPKSWLVWQS